MRTGSRIILILLILLEVVVMPLRALAATGRWLREWFLELPGAVAGEWRRTQWP